MTTPHTPGPWIVDDWLVRPQDMRDQLDNDSEWVAVGIGDEDGYAESVAYCHLANARLIAAAPELLHALQLVMTWNGIYDQSVASAPKAIAEFNMKVGDKIRSAISKATTP